MAGDMDRSQEIALLNFLANITVKEDLHDLIAYIVDSASQIFRVRRCSIYLIPGLVPKYTGELLSDPGLESVSARSIEGPFIVMAGTNYPDKKDYVGRMYYKAGSDLTGWVFETGRTLRLKDASDVNELMSVDPRLGASGGYVNRDPDSDYGAIFPILYIPLRIDSQTIGVLKLHRPNNRQGFDDEAESIGTITAQILGKLIEKIQTASNQSRTILSLAEFGTEKNPQEVYQHITATIPEMLGCSRAQLYLRDPRQESIYLAYQNGSLFSSDTTLVYGPREGFVGWIFKTGRSLNIENVWEYWDPVHLTDEVLERISDGTDIEEEDRTLEVSSKNKPFIGGIGGTQPFIGVPIFDSDNSIQGVLCAHSLSRSKGKMQRSTHFTDTDLQRLKTFASFISLATLSERTRNKAELLLQMSRAPSVEKLFNLVATRLPELIHHTDCFIFELERSEQPCLHLVQSNCTTVPLSYAIGEGKTGISALAETTTVIDHYGRGSVNAKRIEKRRAALETERPQDLLSDLLNEDGDRVGIIRLENGRNCPEDILSAFDEMCRAQVILKGKGLPSPHMDAYSQMHSHSSFSFISVPVLLEQHQLEGVIAIARFLRRSPFSDDEIQFVQAISKAIAQVLGVLELQEQRRDLYVTLAHEITTCLTPIRADAENLQLETMDSKELSRLVAHLVGQVDRLSLMSETILGVVTGKKTGVKLTTHSIYRPLKEAISMFSEEAFMNGCEILGPRASDQDPFPNIEMRFFELTLAFKNLLHNAIKYSFRPPRGLEKNRFVRLTGKWYDRERQLYCISIQNYGVGITEEEIRRGLIFKPYYRGLLSQDRERTGSGIGLSYVYHVVKTMHHGDIKVESVQQGGEAYLTTFHVILPLRQPRTG